ncbi:MAG: PaaI family thioesterase [bacterium]|nr:PaaI family thioesterase [bacterium]
MITEEERYVKERASHAECLLCGARDPLGLGLAFKRDADGAVSARLTCRNQWQGYPGQLHGGMIASVLDSAMTHCLFHHGVQAVTGEMQTRYLHPVPSTAEAKLRAVITQARPPLFRLRAELLVDERVLAWSEAKFMQLTPDDLT